MAGGTYTMFTMFTPKPTEFCDSPMVLGRGPMALAVLRVVRVPINCGIEVALAFPYARMKIEASHRFRLAVSLVEKWNPEALRTATRSARGGIDESQACGETEQPSSWPVCHA